MIRVIWGALVNLIFPSNIYCIACGNLINSSRSYAICDACINEMNWATEGICHKCGRILNDASLEYCDDCSSMERQFDQGYSCTEYGEAAQKIVHNFKYYGKGYYGEKLAKVMHDKLKTQGMKDFDLIIPVPMFYKKEKKRGFNQATLMASHLGKMLNVGTRNDILIRNRSTEAMRHLGAEERMANVSGAFSVKAGKEILLKDKQILLVDDVYTTGSTIDECAAVLKGAGAKCVDFITFAA